MRATGVESSTYQCFTGLRPKSAQSSLRRLSHSEVLRAQPSNQEWDRVPSELEEGISSLIIIRAAFNKIRKNSTHSRTSARHSSPVRLQPFTQCLRNIS